MTSKLKSTWYVLLHKHKWPVYLHPQLGLVRVEAFGEEALPEGLQGCGLPYVDLGEVRQGEAVALPHG